jgi:hypothetical protein
MNLFEPTSTTKPDRFQTPALLGLILLLLFGRFFIPCHVQFANEGPLGQQVAAAPDASQTHSLRQPGERA